MTGSVAEIVVALMVELRVTPSEIAAAATCPVNAPDETTELSARVALL